MKQLEHELLELFYDQFYELPQVELLCKREEDSIGCVSFNISRMHYNLLVRLLNDCFGIQTRGLWSCASRLSHYLFKIKADQSKVLMQDIEHQELTDKPEWVRISLHPIMTNSEVVFYNQGFQLIIENQKELALVYT